MITWMQRHKKWLIVTIWISTIAFVGAGFVGWGSYNYGKSDGAVATVNGNEVPLKDLQNEYSSLYSQYAQMFGNTFNQELAKQMKLEEIAFQKTIQKHLLLNYARELGLTVTDEEVAKQIATVNSFFKEGKFDKNTYISVLKQNNRSVNEFEAMLKQDLILQKVQSLFEQKLSDGEVANIAKLLFSQDKVAIKIIDSKGLTPNIKEEEIKNHYEQTKDQYKTLEGYEISYSKIENIEGKDRQEMKKVALKEYLSLKKGEKGFAEKSIVYDDKEFLNENDFQEIVNASSGDTLKPILKEDNFYVIKLEKKLEPAVKAFAEVKNEVKQDLIVKKTNDLLEEKAKSALENFEGKDIGYIGRNTQEAISGLTQEESFGFIQQLFSSQEKSGFINLGTKVVVYNITDSKLAQDISENEKQIVISNIENMKAGSVLNNLIAALEKRYEIKSYMESK